MAVVGGWEQLEPLGEGGQSRVFKVRSPARVQERRNVIQEVKASNPWGMYAGPNEKEIPERIDRLAMSIWSYTRPEGGSDLGALKMFKIDGTGPETDEAIGRLKNEIAVLRQNIPGMVRLLDANEQEKWIVTEYMPGGTLEKHPGNYTGNAERALRAFRSIVATTASLHKEKKVHRDIKPANVFIAEHDRLVLGDLGIVYLPDERERLTVTDEKVGPRDYMPQWGDLGKRLENVHTNFDVYMLGKLLWCMTAGRLKLPREYFKRDPFNLTVMFPDNPDMYAINRVLDKCVVEEPDQCLNSAVELLDLVDESLGMIERGGQLLTDDVPRPCRVCGRGHYRKLGLDAGVVGEAVLRMDMAGKPLAVSMFVCDICSHADFFRGPIN